MNNTPLIDLTHERGPLYLCAWEQPFVEIHNRDTLGACYADVIANADLDWGIGTLADVLRYMDTEPDDRTIYCCDNMTIQRIK